MKARNKFSKRVAVIAPEGGDGRTQQNMKEAVDINNILAKYRRTGTIEHVKRNIERFGDFTGYTDEGLLTNLDRVTKAQHQFEQLPSSIRNECKNSLPEFLKYIANPKNKDQCIEWGIFNKPTPAAPAAVAPPAEPAVPPGSKPDGSKK